MPAEVDEVAEILAEGYHIAIARHFLSLGIGGPSWQELPECDDSRKENKSDIRRMMREAIDYLESEGYEIKEVGI